MLKKIKILLVLLEIFLCVIKSTAQIIPADSDTVDIDQIQTEKYDQFYDSLEYKANKNKITRLFYNFLISSSQSNKKNNLTVNYYGQMEGKTISKIKITPLEVFGPDLDDTTKQAKGWLEKTTNKLHTKSSVNTIKKLLLFHVGDTVNAALMYENERLIRNLSYIKDVRFVLVNDSTSANSVDVHIITKDRFSIGLTGDVNGINSAALEFYNNNIFGVGHEISLRFVGHLKKQPYTGIETFYKINNIEGKFIDISAGYMNTYLKEGFSLSLDRPFITPSLKWGYGVNALRMYRTNKIFNNDPFISPEPFDITFLNGWIGRSFQIRPNQYNNSQLILSAGINSRYFHKRPDPALRENQYFSNSTFYLASITFSQRHFIPDQLVYSYGITEDIPEGFKNEIVYGYDSNEFGNRHYLHLFFSNGNLLIKRRGYLYMSAGIGGYFNKSKFEQGQIEGSMNFISRRFNAGRKRGRLFIRSNYLMGIHRFAIENLDLSREQDIRGFASSEAIGKQKLSVDFEYVIFLRHEFYHFNMALFGFTDLGIIGSNNRFIFTENYYSGLGIGLRLHNENLVFKTFQLRLAFYPFHPDDMNFTGFILSEQLKRSFYSFEPTEPQPLPFE